MQPAAARPVAPRVRLHRTRTDARWHASQVRPLVLHNYLQVMRGLHPEKFCGLPTYEEMVALWGNVPETLVKEKGVLMSNPFVLAAERMAQAAAFDVAGVRTAAVDGEDAAGGGDGERAAAPDDDGTVEFAVDGEKKATTTSSASHSAVMRRPVPSVGETLTGLVQSAISLLTGQPAAGGADGEGEVGGGGDRRAEPPVLRARREVDPINEFEKNLELMRGVFWHLFPAAPLPGITVEVNGVAQPVDPLDGVARHRAASIRHLLRQHTGVFGQHKQLLFLLLNQRQRWAAARSVALRVKNSPESFDALKALMEEEDIAAQLAAAAKDPGGAEAKALLARIMPLVSQAGRAVPFGPLERERAISSIINLARTFGAPSVFLTGTLLLLHHQQEHHQALKRSSITK